MDKELAAFTARNVKLFLGPRPGKKSLRTLTALELTHCCTLLSEREGAPALEAICRKMGVKWFWLPLEGGGLEILRNADIAGHILRLSREIQDEPEPRLYFHCSAGIHRTGFFVYVLLRLFHLDRDAAFAELARLRPVTAEQVGEERLDLADELVETLLTAKGT